MKYSKKILNMLKEPLLHFLMIGAALFLIYAWRDSHVPVPMGQVGERTTQVNVTQQNIDQMNSLFVKTYQRLPTEKEQKGLVEDFIRSEIYYREALAIGLDRDDEVLKRRLRQKMEFIYEDISSWAEPTNEDLQAFMEKHREKYLTDPRLAFHQVYISPIQRRLRAESDARQILAQLIAGGNPNSFGDPTLLETEIPLTSLYDIKKQFGEEFGEKLLELKPGGWAGPIPSAFGLHLVLVREAFGSRLPGLSEVRETVHREWTAKKQKELKDASYAKIRERYSVIVEKPKIAAADERSIRR